MAATGLVFVLYTFFLLLVTSVLAGHHTNRASLQNTVVAHHLVGITYSYTVNDWKADILLASQKGIDGFALNVGRDPWQPNRVADAYNAASQLTSQGIPFRLFMSFDMTSLPCGSPDNANALRQYIIDFHNHPNQFIYNGKVLVSTFGGEYCYFGTGSVNDGWTRALKAGSGLPAIHFVPAFFVDPSKFPGYNVIDGAFNWNSGWPLGDYDINFDSDRQYLSALGTRSYMAAVSPWFFTHYDKNFIYRGDDWLFAERWELLIQNRMSIDIVQAISWNDYGESHYLGPIKGDQPGSQAWVNGFDHQGWLDLMQYYISAYKSGSYPPIKQDRIFMWARPYPANANAPDRIGRPNHWQWTDDYLWVVVLMTRSADITLSCGSSQSTTSVSSGLTKLKLALKNECSPTAKTSRGLTFTPSGFFFRMNPPNYNFNAFVAASPL